MIRDSGLFFGPPCILDLICDVMNVLRALLLEKLSVYDLIAIRKMKRRRDGCQTNFYMNFHLKDDLRMECVV